MPPPSLCHRPREPRRLLWCHLRVIFSPLLRLPQALEVNPLKVYLEVLNEAEERTGKVDPKRPRHGRAAADAAAADPEVCQPSPLASSIISLSWRHRCRLAPIAL